MRNKTIAFALIFSILVSCDSGSEPTTVPTTSSSSDVTRSEIEDAMLRATRFMVDSVAANGGYVFLVSEDLSRRWGENLLARPSQIWLQEGTEKMGQVFLDAYEATQNVYYLEAARDVADVIVGGQRPTGGWHYFIDFDPSGIPEWYENTASKFRWGMEEYRHYYDNATFDDGVTQSAAQFLLRFYNKTQEQAYREPLLKALEFVLEAQYPNGAWPQRFPLHDDYTSFYTLNDGVAQKNIELLLEAYRILGDQRYFEGAQHGVDALIALQGPKDQAAWAEQYGFDMQPIAARTHEPAGYVVRESRDILWLLVRFYLLTGDVRYLEPISGCLNWFSRISREMATEKYPRPRYWEPGTNRPLYSIETDELTPEGYGKYIWTTDPTKKNCGDKPCSGEGIPIPDASWISRANSTLDHIKTLMTPAARTAFSEEFFAPAIQSPSTNDVRKIISAFDSRGAWVTDGNPASMLNAASTENLSVMVRGISTAVFAKNMSTLIAALPGKTAAKLKVAEVARRTNPEAN